MSLLNRIIVSLLNRIIMSLLTRIIVTCFAGQHVRTADHQRQESSLC